MSIFEQQMRSLTVAPVMLDAPPRKIVPEIFPQASNKLKGFFSTKKIASSSSQPKDEYLLILTCDRLAILKGDPANEGSIHGGSVHGGNSTAAGSPSPQEQSNPPFVSIPLSLLKGAHADGSTLILEHYLPSIGNQKQRQPSSPTVASGIPATINENANHFTPSISSASSTGTTASSSSSPSLLFNDDGAFSFPLISASVAAIARLRRGDTPETGKAILRLHTDSAETAQELAKAVHTALQRLLNALLWLDRGLPLEIETSLAVSTVSLTFGGSSSTANISQNGGEEVILTRAPAWGSTVKLPLVLAQRASSAAGTRSSAVSSSSSTTVNIDICTPLGPCHAVIPIQKVLSLPAGEELTVPAVCSAEAQSTAGSLNLSASVTIGNVVVNTSTISDITTATQQAGNALLKSSKIDSTSSSEVIVAGCLGAILALLGTTFFSSIVGTLSPAALFIIPLISVVVVLFFLSEKKKKNSRKSAFAVAAGAGATTSTSQEKEEQKKIKVIESFSLLHAEIVEGPGEDQEDIVTTTTTTTMDTTVGVSSSKQPKQPPQKQLTRQITASLAQRDSYLQRSASTFASLPSASPATFARLTSVKGQQQQHQPGGALVDIGAVSLRRVVSRSVAPSAYGAGATVIEQEHVDIHAATAKIQVQRPSESAEHEAEVLAKLHALSSNITPALFDRYITACGGDRKKALTRLKATAEWRAANGIDDILTSPVPRFKAIKAAYLHSVIGWTRDQTMPVVVEGMGGFKKALLQLHEDNITPAEMIQQFVFVLEWVLNDLTRDKAGSFVRIYDLKGIRLFDLADKEAIALGQQMMDLLEKYYPERMAKAYVVNTPSFFATAWKMVKPMLDPRTAKKIQVLAGTQQTLTALQELMDDDVIPVAYGGKNPIFGYDLGFTGGWYQGEIEKTLSAMADDLNNV